MFNPLIIPSAISDRDKRIEALEAGLRAARCTISLQRDLLKVAESVVPESGLLPLVVGRLLELDFPQTEMDRKLMKKLSDLSGNVEHWHQQRQTRKQEVNDE